MGSKGKARSTRAATLANAARPVYGVAMEGAPSVLDGLRRALATSRTSAAFVSELGGRLRQLLADMVDGRVLPRAEADALRASILDLVRSEALAELARRSPKYALDVLDTLSAFGLTQLEGERPRLEADLATRFPAPAAAAWSELVDLREAAARRPDVCRVAPPVRSVYFAHELAEEGAPLPDELLALHAFCESFDLACGAAPHVPVLSLAPPRSLDACEPEDGYPLRQAVFQGGDEVELSVYRDERARWWLVYEYEYRPITKAPLDLRAVVRFGLQRMTAEAPEALYADLSWEAFFGAAR